MLRSDVEIDQYEVSDGCEPLIALWQALKGDPIKLVEDYAKNWRFLEESGVAHYRDMRREFNQRQNPHVSCLQFRKT